MPTVRPNRRLRFRVKKRVSDEEVVASQPKRHQPLGKPMKQTAALDDIPVRSVSFPTDSPHSSKSRNFGYDSFNGCKSVCTNVSSAHGSFPPSTIFSTTSEATTSFTSVGESFVEPSTQHTYEPCTQENEALDECFESFDTASSGDYRIEWPAWNYDCLDEAAYGHLWEYVRLKSGLVESYDQDNIMTNVDLTDDAKVQGQQRQRQKWHSQPHFRAQFNNTVNLAPPSDHDAWIAALTDCSKDDSSVIFSGHLSLKHKDSNVYDFTMHPLKMQRSYRLQRRFGANRFMEITVSRTDIRDPRQFARWIAGGMHYFLGRRWIPFFVKDATERRAAHSCWADEQRTRVDQKVRLYFFAAFGDEFRGKSVGTCERSDMFEAQPNITSNNFLRWALNIQNNSQQTVCKLFSRISLNLTRATATIELQPSQVRQRNDVISATGEVMTDGIGRMSRSLCNKVSRCLKLHPPPSAFQARIGGAKGIWIVDTTYDGEEDWLEILPSQTKWNCSMRDRHHRMFEVVSWPKPLIAGELSLQLIPILENGAIKADLLRTTLKRILKDSLTKEFNLSESVINEPLPLRSWINSTNLKANDKSQDSTMPFSGGLPTAMSDRALFLLDSGFSPVNNAMLAELVSLLAQQRWDELERRMRISIPCSTVALMVADFTGLLKEGEIHLSFSTEFDAGEQFCDTLLEEFDVLVARNPAHLPSDIQKVRAVSIPQLRGLKDVIVFSTKGDTPLASLLSGGDYDGDKAWICWDQSIVQNFKPSPLPPRPEIMQRMTIRKDKTTVAELPRLDDDAFLRQGLTFNLQSSMLGICTNYKEKLCYKYNTTANEKAIALSFLLSDLVDQAKQGTIFTEEDWRRFRLVALNEPKTLAQPNYLLEPSKSDNPVIWKDNETHILDDLHSACKNVANAARHAIKAALPQEHTYDPDLSAMYKYFDSMPEPRPHSPWSKILPEIGKQNEEVKGMWALHMNHKSNTNSNDMKRIIHQRWLDIQPPAELRCHPEVAALLQPWAKDQSMNGWSLLKASTLYYRHHKSVSFVWSVAGRQLAALKQQQQHGVSVTVSSDIYPFLKLDKKRIAKLYDDHDDDDFDDEM